MSKDWLERTIEEFYKAYTIEVDQQLQGIRPADLLSPPSIEDELEERATVAKLLFKPLDGLTKDQIKFTLVGGADVEVKGYPWPFIGIDQETTDLYWQECAKLVAQKEWTIYIPTPKMPSILRGVAKMFAVDPYEFKYPHLLNNGVAE